jgi:hypothetical protein
VLHVPRENRISFNYHHMMGCSHYTSPQPQWLCSFIGRSRKRNFLTIPVRENVKKEWLRKPDNNVVFHEPVLLGDRREKHNKIAKFRPHPVFGS